ncbi:hypothetical protein ACLMJK_008967 [Lecanora helva]
MSGQIVYNIDLVAGKNVINNKPADDDRFVCQFLNSLLATQSLRVDADDNRTIAEQSVDFDTMQSQGFRMDHFSSGEILLPPRAATEQPENADITSFSRLRSVVDEAQELKASFHIKATLVMGSTSK